MMAFDNGGIAKAAFNNIGVNCTLQKEVNLAQFFGFFIKNFYKFRADYFTLLLRVGYAFKLCQKLFARVNADKVKLKLFFKSLLNLVALVMAHKTVVHKYAGKVFTYGFMHKNSRHGGIYPARKSAK